MRLGIGSYTYPWSVGATGRWPSAELRLSALDLLAQAQRLGVRVVQLCDSPALHELGDGELGLLRKRADASDISLEIGTRGISKEHVLRYVALAKQLGSPIIRTLIDSGSHHPDVAEAIALLRAVAPTLEREGVCLAIENHDRFPARELKQIFDAVDSTQVRLCFDTANSFGCFERPEDVWDVLAEYVVNFHVKDVRVRRFGHSAGFIIEGQPAGQGMLDLRGLLRRAHAIKPTLSAIVEHWPIEAETIDATALREREWAEASVTFVREVMGEQ